MKRMKAPEKGDKMAKTPGGKRAAGKAMDYMTEGKGRSGGKMAPKKGDGGYKMPYGAKPTPKRMARKV